MCCRHRDRLCKWSWNVVQAIIRSHLKTMSTSDDNDAPYSDDRVIDGTAPSAMEWTALNTPSSDNTSPAAASVNVASESTTADGIELPYSGWSSGA